MRARFSYDLEKDFDNYRDAYLDFKYPRYGNEKVDVRSVIWPSKHREIMQTDNAAEKERIVRLCLEEFTKSEKTLIQSEIKTLEEVWAEKEGRFIQKMEKYFGQPFNLANYDVYFTSLGISPYDWQENWFMVRLLSGVPEQIGTICHELMHLYFMNAFQIYLAQNGLSYEDILNINEAITVLINYEFSDYVIIPHNDEKPTTRELKDEIIKLYRDGKEFNEILDRLIELQKG